MNTDVRQVNRKRLAKLLTQNYILPDTETLRRGEGELVLEFVPKLHKKTEAWEDAEERAYQDATRTRTLLIHNKIAAEQPQFGQHGPFRVIVSLDCEEEQQQYTAKKHRVVEEVA